MEISRIRVFGFEMAFHAMRNPLDSWEDSDSTFYQSVMPVAELLNATAIVAPELPVIGPKDLELACKLIRRGSEHRKFMRQIMIWVNITIPRYVWQELDTYKVATVRNSCSTMNTLGKRDLDQSAFQLPVSALTLDGINKLGRMLREAKEEHEGIREARQRLKNDLPEGFLQKATYTFSYETALSAILQRENHRLPEWRRGSSGSIVETLLSLPLMGAFYDAATWKRTQLREIVAELAGVISMADDGGLIAIDKSVFEDMRTKLKKAI